jgi:hypothetical protein
MVELYRQGKHLIRPAELSILPAESSSCKAGGIGEGNFEFDLTKYLCSNFEGFFQHAVKSYDKIRK